ncbi:MAG: putative phosphodiesterase [Candidatus Latescibacterota bacterium]|jgi:predicted phosphodiesterase
MSVRFALLTDSHYHPQAPEDYAAPKMLTRGREVLSAIPEAVNALSPDFVIHAGDLLCGGSSFALPTDLYEQSVDEVADAFAKIQAPFHCVPGNHDCDAQSGSFAGFARRFPLPDPLMIKEVAPRLRLALANVYHSCSSIEESSGIWTDALDVSLRKAATQAAQDGAALLLVLHTWVLSDHTLNRGLVKNAERLVETISSHPAIAAVFTGHRHLNRIRMYRDFLVVDTSCLIGFPLGFRLVTLEDNGLFNTTFHTLPLTEINEASYARSTREENDRWQGEIHDRETEVFLPRLRQSWS